MRIAVLTGGSTPERDVALAGAAQVVGALRDQGHQVAAVDTVHGILAPEEEGALLRPAVGRAPPSEAMLAELAARELGARLVDLPALREADLVFLVLHGRQGEGGEIQSLLDGAGLTYTGSGPLGSALAMDKDLAKRLFRDAGVPTADWLLWPADAGAVGRLGFPLIVKPSKVGSTVGLSVVEREADVADAVAEARRWDDEVLLERHVPGREFTVGVLGDRALAVGEIIPQHTIFDYECKYTPGMTDEIFPAALDAAVAGHMQELAVRAHRALKLRDFSRVDFRLDREGRPQCLEVNTLPGLTATSLLPQSAAAIGISFPELCDEICRLAAARTVRQRDPTPPVALITDMRTPFSLTTWVRGLIIANAAVFLLQLTVFTGPWFQLWLAFHPDRVLAQPWGAVTYMFVHGGFLHLAFNMLMLFIFGPAVEERMGSGFPAYYFVSGIGGAVFSFLVSLVTPVAPFVGASAAVFGVSLAFAMFWPNAEIRIFPLPIPIKVKWFVAFLAATNLLAAGANDGVAHLAHLGGLLFGYLYLKAAASARHRVRPTAASQPPRGHQPRIREPATTAASSARPRARQRDLSDEVDRVLEKISASGLDSLTPDERKLLDEVSRRLRDD